MSYSACKKREILQKVLKEGKKVSEVCQQAGISRKTFYQWKKRYLQAPKRIKTRALEGKYVEGAEHPKSIRHKFKDKVIRLVIFHPSWGSRKIANALNKKRKKKISHQAIYDLLKDLKLETKEKRHEYSNL